MTDDALHLGARSIPVPASVSEAARRLLAMPRPPLAPHPPRTDTDAWRARIAALNTALEPRIRQTLERAEGQVALETTIIAGVPVHVGTPREMLDAHRHRAWLTFHGGSFIYCAGPFARAEAAAVAAEGRCAAYSVDYRMPPDDPYPASLDDAVAVYGALLERHEPQDIVVSGSSAGGNLAAAAMLRARDAGLALPGALILNTPMADLTESGDSFHTLRGIDGIAPVPMADEIALYAGGHDLALPYLSPVFADFSAGFPPTYIQSGTRDLLLSNAVRLHRALRSAGIEAELHIWEAAPHGGFGPDAPETAEAQAERSRFVAKHWGVARGAPRPRA